MGQSGRQIHKGKTPLVPNETPDFDWRNHRKINERTIPQDDSIEGHSFIFLNQEASLASNKARYCGICTGTAVFGGCEQALDLF